LQSHYNYRDRDLCKLFEKEIHRWK